MFSEDSKKEFLSKMSETLEVDPSALTLETELSDLNWDSVAVISAIALIDECFGVVISAEKIFYCQNINDIIELASKEK